MGLLSLGSGLVKDDAKIGILVLRAITGVCEYLTSSGKLDPDMNDLSCCFHYPIRAQSDRSSLA